MTQIGHRSPPAPLPYRPMSAGPILHHSSRHLNTSHSHLADLGSGTPSRGLGFGATASSPPSGGVLSLNPLHHPNRHKISSSSSDVVKQLKNKVIYFEHKHKGLFFLAAQKSCIPQILHSTLVLLREIVESNEESYLYSVHTSHSHTYKLWNHMRTLRTTLFTIYMDR